MKKKAKQTDMKAFLKGIDFKLLKKQKATLLEEMDRLEPIVKNGHPDNKRLLKVLEGVLPLIDKIQDIAVDEFGYKESDVLNVITKKELKLQKKIQDIYEDKGVGAALQFANDNDVEYKHCKACDALMPSIHGECAICGQATS